jgi:ABC-type phosphate transport system substrate-binding protein
MDKKTLCKAILIWICFTSFAAADSVIILNKSIAVENINADLINQIYHGKKSRWESGEKIVITALNSGEAHEDFLRKYIKKNPEQFSTYWKKMFFTGNGVPPKSFSSQTEMMEFVSTTKGAIGYVDDSLPNDDVIILKLY